MCIDKKEPATQDEQQVELLISTKNHIIEFCKDGTVVFNSESDKFHFLNQ